MPGLQNLGNTCYMNATLQCLANVLNYKIGTSVEIGKQLKPLIDGLREHNDLATIISAKNLIPVLPKKFQNRMQHDAHEFLVLLLEELEKDDATSKDVIHGKYNTEVKCMECKHKSITKYTFNVLTVDVLPTFAKSLERFQATERISDGKYECEKCQKEVCATKRFILKKWPHVAIFHFSRFTSMFSKKNDLVKFPFLFKLSNNIHYELIGVVNHMGCLGGGHYTAYIKTGKKWFLADDTSFSPIEKDRVISPMAYLIFYRQVQP